MSRPTWALIEEAQQALGIAEGLANTVASRRDGADRRLAQQVADAAKGGQRKLALIDREDPAEDET